MKRTKAYIFNKKEEEDKSIYNRGVIKSIYMNGQKNNLLNLFFTISMVVGVNLCYNLYFLQVA